MKDPNLKNRLKELDKIDPETSWSKEELWETLETKLEGQKSNRRFLNGAWPALPWAAMVLFALGLYWWSTVPSSRAVEVISIEVQTDPILEIESNEQLAEGKNFILEACRKELDVCASPSFRILYEELSRIEEEKMLLSEAVKQYGADEIATRAMIQLENAESSITSQLVSMIMI